ncbi:glycosyltransferase family 2 protein [Protaetiibacter intestinalis]|uniref:Glycosyltransferase n=1 Tax=Protaetiibacter intestinalis TaxID=2419774 RepID=A0A387BCW0_9MICO|nr:glycosyltransferase [Protaetiibacter intestinalis]AYF98925.1 glycosyltransferase [Protaetiibacter intestinalis]
MPSPSELAVVVCSRERAGMLSDALGTIVLHTPREAEILVVDSASTSAATREAAHAAGVRYVRTDTKGLSIARNVGISATARPYLVYTDDDCVAVERWTEGILERFADERVGAVTGEMIDHTAVDHSAPLGPTRHTRVLAGLDAGHGALMAFRREVLVELGGFDEVLGAGRHLAGAEDLDIFCRILDAGYAVVHDPSCIVTHVHTRDDDAYEHLYRGYGLGLGGLVGKWMRLRPIVGMRMFVTLAARTLRRAVRSRSDARRGPAERAMLAGIISGIRSSRRLALEGGRFVDDDRPAPIVLEEASHPAASGTTEEGS